MPEPIASVIVVASRARPWLSECLAALGTQGDPPFETILVDNGSENGAVTRVGQRDLQTRIVKLAENRGVAAGNNAGAAVARGRLLAFLNDDAIPQPGWIQNLAGALEHDPEVALATSLVVFKHDPSIVDSAGDGWSWWGYALKRGHGAPADRFRRPSEVFGACGTACMITRQAFDDLGGFDERFFVAFEDVDLSYRAQLRGYRCRYVANAVVHHVGSATLGRQSADAVLLGQRNVEWVYLKNTPAALLMLSVPGHLLYWLGGACYFAWRGHLAPFARAKWAVAASLRRILAARRDIQARRRVTGRALWARMSPGLAPGKWIEKRLDSMD